MVFLVVSAFAFVAFIVNGSAALDGQCKSHEDCVTQTHGIAIKFMQDMQETTDAAKTFGPGDGEAIGSLKKKIEDNQQKIQQRGVYYQRAIDQLKSEIELLKNPELSASAQQLFDTVRGKVDQMKRFGSAY